MLRNVSEKLTAKFPVLTLGYSMVKIACGKDTFSEIFQLIASPVECQPLAQKDQKRRKRKCQKKIRKTQKAWRHTVGHFLSFSKDFCTCPSKNIIIQSASGKNACCDVPNAVLSRSELIWPNSRLKITENAFLAKKLQVLIG